VFGQPHPLCAGDTDVAKEGTIDEEGAEPGRPEPYCWNWDDDAAEDTSVACNEVLASAALQDWG
jgi:hypothetical protein